MINQSDELLKYRNLFPILKTKTYLISNSLGAMPESVYERMHDYAEIWATKGVNAWEEEWWELSLKVGNTIAPLIGASQNEISMHPNISIIQSILVSSFNFKTERNKVVFSNLEFPSDMYVYEKLAQNEGAKLEIYNSDDGINFPTEKIINAINEQTLLVPISHVLFKSAYVVDVKSIVEKAHSVGAIVILDAYHSVGTIKVDVKELGVDILIGGVLKWLCGGPGGAFLWINPTLRNKLEPKITGWIAHKNPFAFEEKMEYTDTAYRYLNGTPSIPALYAAKEGPKIVAKAGIDKIREKSIHQTSLIVAKAQKEGYKINTPLNKIVRGGTVTLNMPHAYEISGELINRNIIIDFREGAGIRFAPHFYNTDDEILYALDELKNIIKTKSFK